MTARYRAGCTVSHWVRWSIARRAASPRGRTRSARKGRRAIRRRCGWAAGARARATPVRIAFKIASQGWPLRNCRSTFGPRHQQPRRRAAVSSFLAK